MKPNTSNSSQNNTLAESEWADKMVSLQRTGEN